MWQCVRMDRSEMKYHKDWRCVKFYSIYSPVICRMRVNSEISQFVDGTS